MCHSSLSQTKLAAFSYLVFHLIVINCSTCHGLADTFISSSSFFPSFFAHLQKDTPPSFLLNSFAKLQNLNLSFLCYFYYILPVCWDLKQQSKFHSCYLIFINCCTVNVWSRTDWSSLNQVSFTLSWPQLVCNKISSSLMLLRSCKFRPSLVNPSFISHFHSEWGPVSKWRALTSQYKDPVSMTELLLNGDTWLPFSSIYPSPQYPSVHFV